jgi:hypothetical protein
LGSNLKERDHLENSGVYGRMILKCVVKKWDRGMNWIDLAQKWKRWRELVDAVIDLRVPYNAGNVLTS